MTGGDGLYLPGGIQGTEMPVVSHKGRAADLCLFTLSRNNALANSIEHEFGGIMQIQFLKDVTAMSLDGVGADIEGVCDFLVCLAFGQKLQDLFLTAGKQVIAIYRASLLENADIVLSQDAAHLRAKERLVLRNRLNSTDQIGCR